MVKRERKRIIMCKKDCPIWTVVAIVVALAAIGFAVYVVLEKLHVLDRFCCKKADEGFLQGDGADAFFVKKEESSDVPYTTDKDFV